MNRKLKIFKKIRIVTMFFLVISMKQILATPYLISSIKETAAGSPSISVIISGPVREEILKSIGERIRDSLSIKGNVSIFYYLSIQDTVNNSCGWTHWSPELDVGLTVSYREMVVKDSFTSIIKNKFEKIISKKYRNKILFALDDIGFIDKYESVKIIDVGFKEANIEFNNSEIAVLPFDYFYALKVVNKSDTESVVCKVIWGKDSELNCRTLSSKNIKAAKKWSPRAWKAIKDKVIFVGMKEEMVLESWGKPNQINRSVGLWGAHEQWVYDNEYLYLENGVLTSYQTSE